VNFSNIHIKTSKTTAVVCIATQKIIRTSTTTTL
jgi:hypothetical protein